MSSEYKFSYKSLDDLQEDIARQKLDLAISEDVSVLNQPVEVQKDITLPNRLAIHPMEGCDANDNGGPGELTYRRYQRYARGGAGLIWVEAVAVNRHGLSNPRQLYLHKGNVGEFARLVSFIRQEATAAIGTSHQPVLCFQITHSGRFGMEKAILFHEPELDRAGHVAADHPILTDAEFQAILDDFVTSAHLAKKAGFDLVDVKGCHRYLLSESLAAFTRPGRFGGEYANRTRAIKDTIRRIVDEVGIPVATRINVFDGISHPYGWGTDQNGEIDLSEPLRLIAELREMGVRLINVTASTPYLKPHISRPYDQPGRRGYPAPEHPLKGVSRMIGLASAVQNAVKDCTVVGTGYSWLRQFAPYVAAGVALNGGNKVAGFGRMAFAYPDFARDLLEKGELSPSKVCITCSKCSELKASKKISGCVVRDSEIYVPAYRELT